MLLAITSTTPDATELGYLLHKHPDRVRTVDVGFGQAHVFYPEAGPKRTTVTVQVEVDPIDLARGKGRDRRTVGLEPYVNDRPYAASSMLSVALGRLFGTALSGICDERPELVGRPLDLVIELPVVPVRGGVEVLERIFAPLGYGVDADTLSLDDRFPEWGDSRHLRVRLSGSVTVQRALEHLYVLLPVLDDRKHYWVGADEVDKLMRRGGSWLVDHPEVELISRRYLRFGGLAREALIRLSDLDDDPDRRSVAQNRAEEAVERPISLSEQRMEAVVEAVLAAGGGRILDLGCGEGRLVKRLMTEPQVSEVVGVDVSLGALQRAARHLRLDQLSARRREQVRLLQGALTYTDDRLTGFDVITLVEVVEHVDPERLDVLAEVVFGRHRPSTVVVTTPNRGYNPVFGIPEGRLRHADHRFEWTRAEFGAWAARVEQGYDYTAALSGVGPEDEHVGHPTQLAVFRR